MKCIKPELMQRYIDGETTEAELEVVEDHLGLCPVCLEKVEAKKRFSRFVISSVNQMAGRESNMPKFAPSLQLKTKNIAVRKRILYGLSAACFLLLVTIAFLMPPKQKPKHVDLINSLAPHVDANKPATDQGLMMNIVDPDGNITEIVIE